MSRLLTVFSCCFLFLAISLESSSQVDYREFNTCEFKFDTLGSSRFTKSRFTGYTYREGLRRNMKLIGRDQGLSIKQVTALYEDKRGNIWIGGRSGAVCKFNGINFEFFQLPNASKNVVCIAEDLEGNIWMGTDGSGVFKYDGYHFMRLEIDFAGWDEKIVVWDFLKHSDGSFWMATRGLGIFIFHEGRLLNMGTDNGLASSQVRSIKQDPCDRLWLGYNDAGLSVFEYNLIYTLSVDSGLSDTRVHWIDHLGCDTSYAATRNGVNQVVYDQGHFEVKKLPVDANFYRLLVDKQGRMWAGTNPDRLGCVLYDNDQLTFITPQDGLSHGRITAFLEDSEGNVWMGTYGEGLVKHEPGIFENFNKESGLNDDKPWAVAALPNGQILVGAHLGVSVVENDSVFEYKRLPQLKGDEVYDIFIDSKGNQWFSCQRGGLYKYGISGEVVHYAYPGSSRFEWIFDMTETVTGKMLFVGISGLLTIENNTLQYVLVDGEPLHKFFVSVYADASNNIWIGSESQGLFCLDQVGKLWQWSSQHGLGGNSGNVTVSDILIRNNGSVWIPTFNGVYICEEKDLWNLATQDSVASAIQFSRISMEDGLLSNEIISLFEDSHSEIWAGTNNGIARIKVDDSGLMINNYGKEAGIIDLTCVQNNIAEDRNGNLWWCTETFLLKYNRKVDFIDITPPLVNIDRMELSREDIQWNNLEGDSRYHGVYSYLRSVLGDYLHYDSTRRWTSLPINPIFSYDINNISFEFSAINWNKESELKYEVMLDGLDRNWQVLGQLNRMDYPSLEPGSYTFKVRAQNAHGVWSEPTGLAFVIMPPFWETWWFAVIMVLIFGLIVVWYVRYRVLKLQRENIKLENTVLRRTEELSREKQKSDNLLLNILPEFTAEELKEKGVAATRTFDSASVLFSDFQGFTPLTESLDSEELVRQLDIFFRAYDEASSAFSIEKIKTIGDAYMCACGIPVSDEFHPIKIVAFGLAMLQLTESINQELVAANKAPWPIRIGIHSGPLIAGVVGKKKFAFDIWGDTVNTASRMETHGNVGTITVSASTARQVEQYFELSSRGMHEIKGKGSMELFSVIGYHEKYCTTEDRKTPSEAFLQLFESAKSTSDEN